MKLLLSICVALFVGMVVTSLAADRPANSGRVRHVVCFKFKDTATKDQIKEVEKAFKELKTKIPTIVDYEWGTNVSPENRNKGFTHCFLLTFKNEKDRDAYLVHPDHKAFGKLLGPYIDDVFVFDFVVQK